MPRAEVTRSGPSFTTSPVPRVLHVVTVPLTLRFLRGQVDFMRARGFDVQVASAPGPLLDEFCSTYGVTGHPIPMNRKITPRADAAAVAELVRVLRGVRPDLVHAHTPKGGLVGMLAAAAARVPARIYHMRGLPYLTASGPMRRLLWATESTSCGLAHRVIAVSESLKDAAQRARFVGASRIRVLAGGSSNGVDAFGRFDPATAPVRSDARRTFGLDPEHTVVTFVGRLVGDKGIAELVEAWQRLRHRPATTLFVVGPYEERDALSGELRARIEGDPTIVHLPFTEDMPAVYAASDLVVLPTYREGFPNVPLEAASMGLPVVTTDAVGARDSVVDGVTGAVVTVRDSGALGRAIERYLDDEALRRGHGAAGRKRVLAEFLPERIWAELLTEYEALLDRARR